MNGEGEATKQRKYLKEKDSRWVGHPSGAPEGEDRVSFVNLEPFRVLRDGGYSAVRGGTDDVCEADSGKKSQYDGSVDAIFVSSEDREKCSPLECINLLDGGEGRQFSDHNGLATSIMVD